MINKLPLEYYDIFSIYKYFEKFDNNKDGFLDIKEFIHVMRGDFRYSNNQLYSLICRFSERSNNNLVSIKNVSLLLNFYYHVFELKNNIGFNIFNNKKIRELLSNVPKIRNICEISEYLILKFLEYEKLFLKKNREFTFKGLFFFICILQ